MYGVQQNPYTKQGKTVENIKIQAPERSNLLNIKLYTLSKIDKLYNSYN